jgi:hypothetical protein
MRRFIWFETDAATTYHLFLGKYTKYDHCHVIVLGHASGKGLRSRYDAVHGFHRRQALTSFRELD